MHSGNCQIVGSDKNMDSLSVLGSFHQLPHTSTRSSDCRGQKRGYNLSLHTNQGNKSVKVEPIPQYKHGFSLLGVGTLFPNIQNLLKFPKQSLAVGVLTVLLKGP